MGAEVIILFNPYTYNFLKGLTHIAVYGASQRLTRRVLQEHAGHLVAASDGAASSFARTPRARKYWSPMW